MQHCIFFQDGNQHAIKVSFADDSDTLRTVMGKIRACTEASNAFYTNAENDQSDSLLSQIEMTLPDNVLSILGFTFDVYSMNGDSIIQYSDLSGEPISDKYSFSLGEEERTNILLDSPKTGNISIESHCSDDDGNTYTVGTSLPTEEFLDAMEELARLAETENEVLRPTL